VAAPVSRSWHPQIIRSAAAIALLVLVSSLAGGVTVSAPYHGKSSAGYGSYVLACAKAKAGHPTWSMSSGSGGLGVQSDRSKTCPSSSPGVGETSTATSSSRLDLAFKVRIPNGHHQLTPTFFLDWNVSNAVSMGKGCPAPRPFNYSTSNAPPHAKTATWSNVTGALSTCSAFTYLDSNFQVSVDDLTNYTAVFPAGSSGCGVNTSFSYCAPFYSYLSSYNATGWEFYNDTTYSRGTWHYSSGVVSYNSSVMTRSLNFANASRATFAPLFNFTFVGSHTYELLCDFSIAASTSDSGWISGGATASIDFGSSGYGVTLKSIAIR